MAAPAVFMHAQSPKKQTEAAISVKKGLNDTELSEVVGILKSKFAMPSAVTDASLDAAALAGIVASLSPGLEVSDKKPELVNQPGPSPSRSELMPGDISYVYLADFSPESIKILEDAVSKMPVTTKGFIIDTRFSKSVDFKAAAEAASFFVGPGRNLFKLQNAQNVVTRTYVTAQNPKSNLDIPVMILINSDTSGAPETFAFSLKEQNRGLLVGSQSSGKAALYNDMQLKNGRWLRIATEMALSSHGTPIFPKGIQPDISVDPALETERMILVQAATKNNISEWIIETDSRKRLTEASLVRNENPEIDNMIEAANNKKKENKTVEPATTAPRDRCLQRAIDVIKGIQVLNPSTPTQK